MVDDTPNVAWDDASNRRMVVCRAFERMPAWDVLRGVHRDALHHPKVLKYIDDNASLFAGAEPQMFTGDDFWQRFVDAFLDVGRPTGRKKQISFNSTDVEQLNKSSR